MKVIHLQENHSILNQYLAEIRSSEIQKDSMRFRRNIERIGSLMAVEISRELNYRTEQVQTPLGIAEVSVPSDPIVLGTILRAGMPMHHGFLDIFDKAENAFVSAYRKPVVNADGQTDVEIVSEYLAAPHIDGKVLMMVDPMLASGQSMEISVRAILQNHGKPKAVHLASIIAAEQAIEYLRKNLPEDIDVTVWCCAIDPVLDAHKYIVPGLGDAGDLCYGEKL